MPFAIPPLHAGYSMAGAVFVVMLNAVWLSILYTGWVVIICAVLVMMPALFGLLSYTSLGSS